VKQPFSGKQPPARGDNGAVSQETIQVGVIGVGHLGEYHVQKYKAMDQVELVGVMDINTQRASEIARRYNTTAFPSHHELLRHVGGVSVAVPTECHFDIAKDVMAHGVHLLIEKPITLSLDHADHLITMAREKGLVFQVGHVERFNPAVIEMEALLTRPIFIESHRLSLFTTRGTDVDVVLDLMIHDLDIILHIVPSEIKEVHAVGMSVITGKTDIANVRIIFTNGTVANLTANRVSNTPVRKIRIFQPEAYLSVDCLKREISVTRLNGNMKNSRNFPQITSNKMKYPDSDPLATQIISFVEAVRGETTPVVTGQDGRRALNLALSICDQIAKGTRGFQSVC
jgi:predicted dehydrogenase